MAESKPPTIVSQVVVPPRMIDVYSALQHCASLSAGDGLILCREPHNPVDSNAVLVQADCGHTAGYLRRDRAAILAPWIDAGWVFTTTVIIEGSFSQIGTRVGVHNWPEVRIVPLQRIGATTKITKRERLDA